MFKVYKRLLFYIISAFLVFIAVIPPATYAYFAKDLVSRDRIMNRNNTGVTLLDKNGRPFFTLFEAKNKVFVPLSSISLYAQKAIIVSEDKDFFSHSGISIKAIIRSIYLDLKEGNIFYGGSTITQQLVKNVLLNSNKSVLRKYQELVLAQEIERRYSKNEILEMYLNSVYFGEGVFGIEEAAKAYFGKNAKNLTLGEASFLTALLPAPSKLSPFSGDVKQAYKIQAVILQQMVDEGYITPLEKTLAMRQKLQFNPPAGGNESLLNTTGIHFALLIKDELIKQFGEEEVARSGLTVTTTLDLDWQRYAEKVVENQVNNLATSGVTNGAAVVIDPKNGQVKVMVGSKDWHDDKFGKINMAISPRQPGSSFKPIVYSAAFEKELITPLTILHDVPSTYPGDYKPKNYDSKFRGNVTVRRALSNSLNIPAVEVMSKIGVNNALSMANRLGITTLKEPSMYGLSLVLGAGEVELLELTNVYAAFANGGVKNKPVTILKITDKFAKEIYVNHPISEKVLDPSITFLITSILSDSKARLEIFGNVLDISRPAAVKTGTSEDYRDSLTLGYTPSLAIGVWVGNSDRAPMNQIAGSLGAAPIWKLLMEHFLAGTPVEQFTTLSPTQTANPTITIIPTLTLFPTQSPMPLPTFSSTPSPTLTPTLNPFPTKIGSGNSQKLKNRFETFLKNGRFDL